ncbi:MAG: hypothetical protein ACR2OZ_19535 [Verrucomicrobiales bacterium]
MKTNSITNHLLRRSQAVVGAIPALGACFVIIAALACTNVCRAAPGSGDKIIIGETTVVADGTVATWARVNGEGKVIWVGLTIPLSMAENMPPRGSGPAGAVAVLNFPPVVQATTYFNHAEIHSQQAGHANSGADPHRYRTPHFDFHFYGIPVANVRTIPGGLFFVDAPADRLPEGYVQPEPFSVPQMGRHARTLDEAAATDHWLLTMFAGFLPDASYMHFIEPMITQEFLLLRKNFTLPVPMPATLGRATSYPTECVVHYDEDADAYNIVFKGFEPIE